MVAERYNRAIKIQIHALPSLMHFVIKLFPEIIVKSPGVRRHQTKMLQDNIRRILKPLDRGIAVERDWEKLELTYDPSFASPSQSDKPNDLKALRDLVIDRLGCIPGISKFSETRAFEFSSLEQICEIAVAHFSQSLRAKSFGVKVKRSGKQSFSSMEAAKAVGSALMDDGLAKCVDLKNPDIWVELEVRQNRVFLLGETWPGLGGFPVGSQDKVISLISGGFDSSVSSYQMIRRGMLTHFMFFNIGGRDHEIAVRKMAHHIWSRYGSSHTSRFLSIPFEQIVAEISKKAPPSYSTVLLKRFMMRCASTIANNRGIEAIATGESVGQVSSQTLANLRVIDEEANCLVVRPLISLDKGDIIDTARKIGTAQMAEASPEYCGLRSDRPTTKARRHVIEEIESTFDPHLIEQAIAAARQMPVSEVIDDIASLPVDLLSEIPKGSVVVDVRHPEEVAEHALVLQNAEVVLLPFFEIQKKFVEQPQNRKYLLYCARGIMSRLHAELLLEAGYQNVGVYKPKGES